MRTVVQDKPIACGVAAALWVFFLGLLVWDAGCQSGVPLPAKKPTPVDVYADARLATVAITRFCDGKPDAYGSGLAVGDRDVVTVRHVVVCAKGAPSYLVRFADGSAYPMKATKVIEVPEVIGKYSDGWARLTVVNDAHFKDSVKEPVLAFPKPGETACALTSVPTIAQYCGTVISMNDGKPTFAFTLSVLPGNSGSPVFDSNGKLIGFVVDCWVDSKGACEYAGGDAMISMGALFL